MLSLSKLRGFEVHPTTDWPGTCAELTVEAQAQSLVAHGEGSSSASSIGSLAGASEQRFQAERYEGTLANPTKFVTAQPRKSDRYLSASVEDADVSIPPVVDAALDSQLPENVGCTVSKQRFAQ